MAQERANERLTVLGQALEDARLRRPATARLSQEALAEGVGMSRSTYLRVIRGEADITLGTIHRLSKVLGLSVDEIIALREQDVQRLSGEGRMLGEVTTSRAHERAEARPLLPRLLRHPPHRIRVWMQEFRLELTKAGATDEEIEEAMSLITTPQVFTFYAGGKPRDFTEDDVLTGMKGIAVAVRAELKRRGRKFS